PRVSPHAAQRVAEILAQLRQVLAGGDRGQIGNRVQPYAGARQPAAGVALLLAEDLLHLAAVVGAEVERQQPQQAAEQVDLAHVNRALGIRLFARAMPSAVSMRRASAQATLRPNSVRR